jgi:hypothetical protein
MNETTRDVECEETQKPENQQHHEDRPEHFAPPFPGSCPRLPGLTSPHCENRAKRIQHSRRISSAFCTRATPSVANGFADVFPLHFSGGELVRPAALELGLDVFELSGIEIGRRPPSQPVAGLVMLVGAARLVVGPPLEVLSPVSPSATSSRSSPAARPPVPTASPLSMAKPVAVPVTISRNAPALSPVEAMVSASSSAAASVDIPRRMESSGS